MKIDVLASILEFGRTRCYDGSRLKYSCYYVVYSHLHCNNWLVFKPFYYLLSGTAVTLTPMISVTPMISDAGNDTIVDGAGADSLPFGTGLNKEMLWFSRAGLGLYIDIWQLV